MREAILDAAVELATRHGIAHTSVGEVARLVGISRPTLYTHFSSKDELVTAAIVREAMEFVSRITNAAAEHDDPRAALHAGIVMTLVSAREHPLLDRVLTTEPEVLLPFLTSDGGPILALAGMVIREVVDDIAPQIDSEQRRLFSDLLTRLLVSYSINAPTDPPEVIASTMCALLFDGVLAAQPGVLAAQPGVLAADLRVSTEPS